MPPTNNKEVERAVGEMMKRIEREIEYDATQWNGMLVFEAGDYDRMFNILSTTLHQELQKARHDWLREEIVRLEGMKKELGDIDESNYDDVKWQGYDMGCNQALQTIIDRYLSELDQPK